MAFKEVVLARASKPSKSVAKVVAVRINGQTYDILKEQADQAGVKVSDLVRAAIEELCREDETDAEA